ncbi:hypothetical protein K492DRAFT_177479 [Lichtheimia hyalospora FSU 10163]|nr:hypothetical protein K492DRAFT_177479 [Lichtheimia hyalospora FSU 10163]
MSYHRHSYNRGKGRTSVFNRLGRRRQDYDPSYHSSTYDNPYLDDDQYDEYNSSPYDGYMENGDIDTVPPRYGSYRQERYHNQRDNYRGYDPSPSPPPTTRTSKRVGSYSPSEIIITAPLGGGRIVSKGEQSSHPQMLTASFTPGTPSTTPCYDTAVSNHISPPPPPTTAVWINQQLHQPPYYPATPMEHPSYPVMETSHPPIVGQPLTSQHHELPPPTTTRYLDGSELNQIAMTAQKQSVPSPRRHAYGGGDSYIPDYSCQRDGSRSSKKQRVETTKTKHSSKNKAKQQPPPSSSSPSSSSKTKSAKKSASVTPKAHPPSEKSKQASSTKSNASTPRSSKGKSSSRVDDEKSTTQSIPIKEEVSIESNTKKNEEADTTTNPEMDNTQLQPIERNNEISSGESVISMDMGIGEQSDIMLPDWSLETEEEFESEAKQHQQQENSRQQHDKEETKHHDDDTRKSRENEQRQQDHQKQHELTKMQEQHDEKKSKQHDLLETKQSSLTESFHGKRKRPDVNEESSSHVNKEARKDQQEKDNDQSHNGMQIVHKEDINNVQHEKDSDNQSDTLTNTLHDQRQQLGTTTTQDNVTKEEKDTSDKLEHGLNHVAEESNTEQHQKGDDQGEMKQENVKLGLFDTNEDHTLPKPWQAIMSSRGDIYYYNTETGLSTWERPIPLKVTAPPLTTAADETNIKVEETTSCQPTPSDTDQLNNDTTTTTTTTTTTAPINPSPSPSSSTDKHQRSQPETEKGMPITVDQQQQQHSQRDTEDKVPISRDPRLRKEEKERKKSPATTTTSSSSSSTSIRSPSSRSTHDTSLCDRPYSRTSTNDKRYHNDRYYDHYTRPPMDSYRPNYGSRLGSSRRRID